MSVKKYVVYYNEEKNQYYYMARIWLDINNFFNINIQYIKPVLYSDDFELTEKVTRKLNARL
ncbi:hypothetical protein 05601_49 [Lactococcus phage 05601]|uniref:Uncharacterized protein n=1 Tax=Lactococcus phage 05601 TaxID=2029658 RepID=A0A343JNL8_9CAUD|nr:hypothetical protein HYP24_gp49 [Lactococcus phage 05601]ASZ71091.1 hypothetical protein 05601_49 [Lactococcus phage 05601]